MDREVKVRIDLLLDNQASLFDTLKQLNQLTDKYEDKIKRLHNLQGSGAYQIILEKEIDLLRKKNQYQRDLQTANTPLANAQRQLDFENQIYQIQRKRDTDALARKAHYQAKFGPMGGIMSATDRLTMSGFGYGAMSGTMLGMVGSAGGSTLNMFTGTMKRAAGEIGIMFIPAILAVSSHLHSFAGWVRDLNPALKSAIGYLATYGILISGGAKAFSLVMNGFATLKEMVSGTSLVTAAGSLTASAGHLSAAAFRLSGGTSGLPMVASGSSGGGGGGLLPFAAAYSAYRATDAISARTQDARWQALAEGDATGQLALNMFRRFGAVAGASSANGAPPPLSIPGFQSQQLGIFDLKDMVQRESLRDPNEQANFELSVREFRGLLGRWNEWFANNPGGRVGDMRLG